MTALNIRLQEIRKAKTKLNEYEVSLKLGLSKNYIRSVEQGNLIIGLKALERLAQFYGVTLSEVFDGVDVLEEAPTPSSDDRVQELERKIAQLEQLIRANGK